MNHKQTVKVRQRLLASAMALTLGLGLSLPLVNSAHAAELDTQNMPNESNLPQTTALAELLAEKSGENALAETDLNQTGESNQAEVTTTTAQASINELATTEQPQAKNGSTLANLLRSLELAGHSLDLDASTSETNLVPIMIELKTATSAKLGDIASYKQAYQVANSAKARLLEALKAKGINLEVESQTAILLNAFTTHARAKDLKEIAANEEVAAIYQNYQTIARPEVMATDGKRKRRALADEYQGQGQVVAIIDSGFDPNHPDMQITDATKAHYQDANAMEAKLDELQAELKLRLPGMYFSPKFPYGFNYADKDVKIYEKGQSHGMHVSGIVAANGKIKGQAPEAQLLAMRVFSDNGSGGTSSGIYVEAMEHAILLGANAMNMSLGGDYGSLYRVDGGTTKAIAKAKEMGCVVAIAAGNSGYSSDGATKPRPNDPDYSIVGTPSVAVDALSVASINSPTQMQRMMSVSGVTGLTKMPFSLGVSVSEKHLIGKALDVVYVGLGRDEDYQGKDVKGKIALMERGTISFPEKSNNAAKHGALMAIVYQSENIRQEFIGMVLEDTTIPTVSIRRKDALMIKDALEKQQEVQITTLKDLEEINYDKANLASDFSSWGPTPEFDLKPEVAAYGGNVYSTLPDNQYGNLSGTSMATPQIAGLLATLNQRLDADQKSGYIQESSQSERFYLLKNIVMNTASPINGEDGNILSPRKQGAGLMQKEAALKTIAVITNTSENKVAKLNLGNIDNELNFKTLISNFSKNQEVSFSPEIIVETDEIDAKEGYIEPGMSRIIKTETINQTISVKAGETVPFNYTLDLDKELRALEASYPNGYFVEGFIKFTSSNTDIQPDLVVPFISFHGKRNQDGEGVTGYEELPIFEKSVYDFGKISADGSTPNPKHYFGDGQKKDSFTALVGYMGNDKVTLGETTSEADRQKGIRTFDAEDIYFSPNGDEYLDSIGFQGVFTRPCYDDKLEFLTEDGRVIYASETAATDPAEAYIPKCFVMNMGGELNFKVAAIYLRDWEYWGVQNESGAKIKDGKYRLRFSAHPIHKPGTPEPAGETLEFPVKVDVTPITFKNVTYDAASQLLKIDVEDPITNGVAAGIDNLRYVQRTKDGEFDYDKAIHIKVKDGHGEIKLTKDQLYSAKLIAEDRAANLSEYMLTKLFREDKVAGKAKFTFAGAGFPEEYNDSNTYTIPDPAEFMEGIDYTLSVIDSMGFRHKELVDLPEDTYKYEIKLNRTEYSVDKPDLLKGEFKISESNPEFNLEIGLTKKDLKDYVNVEFIGVDTPNKLGLSYTFRLTNLDTNESYDFVRENSVIVRVLGVNEQIYSKVPDGRYKVEVIGIPEDKGVRVKALEPEAAVKGDKRDYIEIDKLSKYVKDNPGIGNLVEPSHAVRFAFNIIGKGGKEMSRADVRVHLETEGNVNLPDDFKLALFDSNDFTYGVKQADGSYLFANMPSKRYLLFARNLPTNLYTKKPFTIIDLAGSDPIDINLFIGEADEAHQGLITIKSKMQDRKDLDKQVNPNYEFSTLIDDVIGAKLVKEDKENAEKTYKLPFGDYYVRALDYDQRFKATPEELHIVIDEEHKEQKYDFVYSDLSNLEQIETRVQFNCNFPNGEDGKKLKKIQPVINLKLTNLETLEEKTIKFDLEHTTIPAIVEREQMHFGSYKIEFPDLDSRVQVKGLSGILPIYTQRQEVNIIFDLNDSFMQNDVDALEKVIMLMPAHKSLKGADANLVVNERTDLSISPAISDKEKATIYELQLVNKKTKQQLSLPRKEQARILLPGDYSEYPISALQIVELDVNGNVINRLSPYLVSDPDPTKSSYKRLAFDIRHLGIYALIKPINKPDPNQKPNDPNQVTSLYFKNEATAIPGYEFGLQIDNADRYIKKALTGYHFEVKAGAKKASSEPVTKNGKQLYETALDQDFDLKLTDRFALPTSEGAEFKKFPQRSQVKVLVKLADVEKYDLQKSYAYYKDASGKIQDQFSLNQENDGRVSFLIEHLSTYGLHLVNKELANQPITEPVTDEKEPGKDHKQPDKQPGKEPKEPVSPKEPSNSDKLQPGIITSDDKNEVTPIKVSPFDGDTYWLNGDYRVKTVNGTSLPGNLKPAFVVTKTGETNTASAGVASLLILSVIGLALWKRQTDAQF